MTPEQIIEDLKRLQSYNTGSVRFVVWPLDKLLWIYEQLLKDEKPVLLVSGEDWADASAEIIDVPNGLDLESEKKAYKKWYEESYVPSYRAWSKLENKYSAENRARCMDYCSFKEWLFNKGCSANTTIETFEG